ncbi:cytochrome b/b6 domain-containing protein [Microbacterium sp. CIAB417]|uniref:cytochrome b/b6 domain-containing protein n=1 Tax=Microbacterium sp. CIAB417 TaxID=2860287 RepID=UPI001FAC6005|nr:cytochrome b/b6 domain-containing protein [Microbacterium sp. CIAB417]
MTEHVPRTALVDRLDAAIRPRAAHVQRALASPVRNTRMAVVVGRVLGLAFVVCFLTGLYSHVLQSPLDGIVTPTRPEHLYGWTQGTHVVVGSMLLPLLLAKLWVVYPRLFRWPPLSGVLSALERGSVAVLVATALVLPVTGILNILEWYPWEFSFRRTHFALAWMLIGALALHIAVQLPAIRAHWRRDDGDVVDGGVRDD